MYEGVAFVPRGDRIDAFDLETGEPSTRHLTQGCSAGATIWRIKTGMLGTRAIAIGLGARAHLHVWDAADGTLLVDTTLDDGHRARLSDAVAARLHDRPVVVTGSYGGAIAIWDLTGRTGEVIDVGPAVWAVAVIDNDTVVAGGPSGLITVKVNRELVHSERPRQNLGIQ